MTNIIEKIKYLPEIIGNLKFQYEYHKAISRDIDCGCDYGSKWHAMHADEIFEIMGPLHDKDVSLKDFFEIKRVIKDIKIYRNHEADLLEDHITLGDKASEICKLDSEHHINSIKYWNDILGPWA